MILNILDLWETNLFPFMYMGGDWQDQGIIKYVNIVNSTRDIKIRWVLHKHPN